MGQRAVVGVEAAKAVVARESSGLCCLDVFHFFIQTTKILWHFFGLPFSAGFSKSYNSQGREYGESCPHVSCYCRGLEGDTLRNLNDGLS